MLLHLMLMVVIIITVSSAGELLTGKVVEDEILARELMRPEKNDKYQVCVYACVCFKLIEFFRKRKS